MAKNFNWDNTKNYPLKKLDSKYYEFFHLERLPNFDKSGSVKGMKKLYYGKHALLVKCGNYIYNFTSIPEAYFKLEELQEIFDKLLEYYPSEKLLFDETTVWNGHKSVPTWNGDCLFEKLGIYLITFSPSYAGDKQKIIVTFNTYKNEE